MTPEDAEALRVRIEQRMAERLRADIVERPDVAPPPGTKTVRVNVTPSPAVKRFFQR
jgi:hypothetical protein